MIPFFRKIRKKMADDNKPMKYARYAIGEILLVVIGILIALQINTWNEERKAKIYEYTLKKEIYNSLLEDIISINGLIEGQKTILKSCEQLIHALEEDSVKQDSIGYLFSNAHFWWAIAVKTNAYETAKLYGMHFFKNDSTRYFITDIFESDLRMVREQEKRQHDYYYNVALPILTEKFEQANVFPKGIQPMIPHNLHELKTDKNYLNILKTTFYMRGVDFYFQEILMSKMVKAKESLEMEMELYE